MLFRSTNGKRMQSLRTAVIAIFDQQYPGPVEVVIIYDRATPDPLSDIEISENRTTVGLKSFASSKSMRA